MEIVEDAEEDQRAKRQSTVQEERPLTAKSPSVSGGTPSLLPSSPPPELPTGLPPSASYQSMAADAETVSSTSRDLRPSEIRSQSPTRSVAEPRKSSQSTRPDFHSYASYGSNGKPKIKLGPRPSLDVGGRPHTSSASSFYRPVSTLPAGLKLFSRGSRKGKERPQSQYPSEPPSMTLSPPPVPEGMLSPVSPGLVRPHTSGGRPSTSSNTGSKPLMSPNILAPKTPAITPEKARLMKAMELRKKKNAAPPASPGFPPPDESLTNPTTPSKSSVSEAPKEIPHTLAMLDDMSKGDDSGIAFDASSTLKTDESDATRSDSYPVSPVGPSEQAESTRASSISESTDETIQEPNNFKQTTLRKNTSEDKSPTLEISQVSEQITMSTIENKDMAVSRPASTEEPQVQLEAHEVAEGHSEVTGTIAEALEAPKAPQEPDSVSTTHQVEVDFSNPPDSEPSTSTVQSVPAELKTESELMAQQVEEAVSSLTIESELSTSTIQAYTAEPEIEPETEVTVQPASPESQLKEWRIPRSKFSVQDLKATVTAPEIPKEPVPTIIHATMPPKSPVKSTFSTDRSFTEGDDENGNVAKRKRRGLVEPIRTDIDPADRSGANSEANFSSDDELMDELQSAVFQEAKPISVSKSPISPVFPSPKKQSGQPGRFSRAFSSPFRKEGSDSKLLETPTPMQPTQKPKTRSVSAAAAYLDKVNQQSAQPLAKKANLGSGISQRIKALEKLGAGASTPPSTTGPTPGASTAFFSVRKGSGRGPSRSPSIAERANSLTKGDASPSISRESSPETLKLRDRSGSIQSRVEAFKSSPIPIAQLPNRSRPESISVTARIVRDPAQPFPAKSEAGKNPEDYTPLDLKQSPLVIDHQKAVEAPKETIQERRLSKERRLSTASRTTTTTTKERRSSITIVKDFISDTRTSISERRRSINLDRDISSPLLKSPMKSPSRPPSVHQSPRMSLSSRLSISSKDLTNGNTLSPPRTAGSSSSLGDEKGDKKAGRASRMLRRMSSSLSSSRKNIAHAVSPTVREDPEPANESATSSASLTPTPTSVNIGDVNVQFPDTLLWKRRSMLLDSQGNLIMSPALTASGNPKDKTNTGATKRFHLTEFRTPAIPDVEMQELPNSVVLDFVEGGQLQIACEDRAGQGHVLNGMISHPPFLPFPMLTCTSLARCSPFVGSLRLSTDYCLPPPLHHTIDWTIFMFIYSCTPFCNGENKYFTLSRCMDITLCISQFQFSCSDKTRYQILFDHNPFLLVYR
jgi:hypothetical protein